MTAWRFIKRSLWHYRRTHLALILAVAATVVFVAGAILIGDSLRATLAELAQARLGAVRFALVAGPRTFTADLADRVAAQGNVPVAPLLTQPAWAATAGPHPRRIPNLQLLGVDERFWPLGDLPVKALSPGEAALNQAAAARLAVAVGDTVYLHVAQPTAMPLEAPLAGNVADIVIPVRVSAILGARTLADFNLVADQTIPANIFVDRTWLTERVGPPGRANLLLMGDSAPADLAAAHAWVAAAWQLADVQLRVQALPDEPVVQLTSARVFIEPAVVRAAEQLDLPALGVLTYFVNDICAGAACTPYSFVSAVGPLADVADATAPSPDDLSLREIAVTQWLADDLQVSAGDEVSLSYYAFDTLRQLRTQKAYFTVAAIVPTTGGPVDAAMTPTFPGLYDAESCREWDPGVPIDLDRVRPADEAYWDDHRGAPKALISAEAGRRLWRNPYGELTALRWAGDAAQADEIAAALRTQLDPAAFGLVFQDVRAAARRAQQPVTSFGQLFLGLSLFLIVAAVLLTVLLFGLSAEQRLTELGALLAMGLPISRIRRWWLAEGAIVLAAGVLVGVAACWPYAAALLGWLATLWPGATAPTIVVRPQPASLLLIALGVWVLGLAGQAWALRQHGRRSPRDLLAGTPTAPSSPRRLGRAPMWPWVALLAALLLAAALPLGSPWAVGTYLAAGALALGGGLGLIGRWLTGQQAGDETRRLTLGRLVGANAARRRGRTLALVALVACGVFLLVVVNAHRRDPTAAAEEVTSGTGGYSLYVRTSLPVPYDLRRPSAWAALGLDENLMRRCAIAGLRVRPGAEASCFNMQRVQQPLLLGAPKAVWSTRRPFRFAAAATGVEPTWEMLSTPAGSPVVPGVADQTTLVWVLGLKLGDTLTYIDEHGQPLQVRLVGTLENSILQGAVLIDAEAFARHFPTHGGMSLFLVETPPEIRPAVADALEKALADYGVEIESAVARLARFTQVERTYIAMFSVLGFLGLLLGLTAVAVLVLRHGFERRAEWALMQAVGFTPEQVRSVVAREYGAALLAGTLLGTVAAVTASLPTLIHGGRATTLGPLAAMIIVFLVAGWLLVRAAAAVVTRGRLLEALRDE